MSENHTQNKDESGNHLGVILLKKLPLFVVGYVVGTGAVTYAFSWVPDKLAQAICETLCSRSTCRPLRSALALWRAPYG